MRKRIISTLMALCMALTLLPVQVLAANYAMGEDAGVSVRALAGTAGTELKADNIDAYVANGLGGGVYTLAEDVTISGTLRVTGTVTLDLNDHVLTITGEDSFITVSGRDTNMTLTDSAETKTQRRFSTNQDGAWVPDENGDKTVSGGVITGGKAHVNEDGFHVVDSGVCIEKNGTLTVTDGTVNAPVINEYGVIAGSGTFNGTVANEDRITGGTFNGPVANYIGGRRRDNEISGGTFYGAVANGYNRIAPGEGEVPGEGTRGLITNGIFYGKVTNAFRCRITGGSFYGEVDNRDRSDFRPIYRGILAGGTFYAGNPGTVADGCCTVTYDDGQVGGTYAKQIVQKGETAIEPDVPSRQGYQFTDWYLDDTKYDFNAAVTGDMTLTAKWTVCDHKGSTAQPTCTTPAICTACGGTLAALGHEWGPWTSGSDNTHTRACKRDGTHTETKDCSGGTATCTAKAVCTVCGGEYGEMAAHSFTAEKAEAQYLKSAATCTEKAIYYKSCAVCGLSSEGTADEATFFSGNALGHTWGAWTSNGSGTHTRRCGTDGCTGTETADCAGGTATCTAKAVCSVCGKSYGAVDTANHDLKHTAAKEPGAFVTGRIEYWTCRTCGKYFADAGGAKEISRDDIIIPRLGAAADSEGGKVSPATFDAGIGASAVTAVTSLAGLALLRRKRRDGE